MRKNKFATLKIIILIILILGVIGYFGYKSFLLKPQISIVPNSTPQIVNYDGNYEYCQFKNACNYINIKTLTDGKISINGQAFWVGQNTTNIGSISGTIAINSQKAFYDNNGCKINLSFGANQIVAEERQNSSCGGLNVFFDGTYTKSNLSLYESDNIKLTFNYPGDWGNATVHSGEKNHGEYVKFANNKNLFSVAGDYGRGSIVNGIEIKVYERTDITTSDRHQAQIVIYTDPENKYWIEGIVKGKNNETAEPFYINYGDSLDKYTVLEYKEMFKSLISSLKYNQ